MGRNGRQKPGGIGDIASHLQRLGGWVIDGVSVVKAYEESLATNNPWVLAVALQKGAHLNGKDPYGVARAILEHHESYNPYR